MGWRSDSVEQDARRNGDRTEQLLVALIDEVRSLRQELAEERKESDRRRREAERRSR